MIIQCQDKRTFLMSDKISSFTICDYMDGSSELFANMVEHSTSFSVCKFGSRASAVKAINNIANLQT